MARNTDAAGRPPAMKRRPALAAMRVLVLLAASGLLGGCTSVPEGIEPVQGFALGRYLGIWYEIARLDHSFERGLQRVTAAYSLREDGGVRVINRGFSVADGAWREAEGRAYFVAGPDVGHLKVSFFGPFYGSYVVFDLDEDDYQYAFVAGNDRSYLWFLARTPSVSDDLMQRFIRTARELRFDTDGLIFVEHD
jgi:apolipoprotein D and lipocalin family protein